MPEDIFRMVVTVAVGLACVAFVIQAIAMVGVYKSVRKMQAKVVPLADRTEMAIATTGPLIEQLGPAVSKFGPIVDQLGSIVERLSPVVDRIGPAVDKIGPALEAAVPVIHQAGATIDEARTALEKVGPILDRATEIIDENRPRIAEVTAESVAIVKSVRVQVDKAGDVLQDAGARAKVRMAQIDESVENTVEQVGQVGVAVKRVMLKPVREMNGIAAGVSAVVSTMVYGSRKSSVDHATQDEEMFI
jgi:methyl-accepting chemotaxis protein